MLTEEGKLKVENLFSFYSNFAKNLGVNSVPVYSAPQIACVYALEMSDGTIKIGVTTCFEKRIKNIKSSIYLNVLRSHTTDFAPLEFMRIIESRCHSKFIGKRVRGEYFDISFEEAVNELDSHAEEIAAALHEADENFIDEFNYYEELKEKHFNSSKINKSVETAPTPTKTVRRPLLPTACIYVLLMSDNTIYIDYTDKRRKLYTKIKTKNGLTVKDTYFTFSMSHETASLITWICKKKFSSCHVKNNFFYADFDEVCKVIDSLVKVEVERSKRILKIANTMKELNENQTFERALLLEVAEVFVGKNFA